MGFLTSTNVLGIGVGELFNKVEERLADTKWSYAWLTGITITIASLVTWQIQRNYATMDQSNNFVHKNYAEYVFNNAPNNSLLFVRGDNNVATFWYQIYGEDRRTDICPILHYYLRIHWYRNSLFNNCPGIVLTDQRKGWTPYVDPFYNWTTFFDDNYDK